MPVNMNGAFSYFKNVNPDVRRPDFTDADCNTPVGAETVSNYIEDRRGSLDAHRRMCGGCDLKPACGTWIMEAELPPGNWGGMYGGMTPGERREANVKK